MNEKNIIGQKIKQAREEANPRITQIDLAARLQTAGLQIDQAGISRIESGTHEVTDKEAKIIADSLGVKVAWLFNEI
jgi:transcriptional regulator with XRE-family HTH domain